jgi:hypothetical protein
VVLEFVHDEPLQLGVTHVSSLHTAELHARPVGQHLVVERVVVVVVVGVCHQHTRFHLMFGQALKHTRYYLVFGQA